MPISNTTKQHAQSLITVTDEFTISRSG